MDRPDIEHLTKSQIVLLTMLVAVVSSTATAIVTVSLVEQAPPEITQTVNRIVERTVERIVPTEVPVEVRSNPEVAVVKEGDLIAANAEKNVKYMVRLYAGSSTSTASIRGIAVVVKREGVFITDGSLATAGEKFTAQAYDGTTFSVVPLETTSSSSPFLYLKVVDSSTTPASFPVPTFFDPNTIRLGATAFSLSGKERPAISIGFIRDLIPEKQGGKVIATTMNAEDTLFGSPIFLASGELIGIHTSDAYQKDRGGFTPLPVTTQ